MRFPCCVLLGVLAICSFLPAQTNPVPFVNNPLVPQTAAPGAAAFQLTVNGTGFASGAAVNWNGSPRATTFVSSSKLQASILASDLATPRTASVTVSNPAPGGGVSNIAYFQVTLPAPSVGFYSTTSNETKSCNKTVLYPQIVADFNGDGKQDVAGTVCDGGYIYVSLGNGDGTFQAPIYTAIIPTGNYGMTVGDFNGDGKMDMAVINNVNSLAVLLGNGDGTFQPAKNYLTAVDPYSISTADFNGDGKLDLIVVSNTDNEVNVLLGNGDGTFQPYLVSPTGGVNPYGLAIGDFNGDGKLDLATSESGSSEVTVMFGNGDGTFTFNNDYFFTLYSPIAVDMNGDGILDLVGLGTPPVGYTGIAIMYGNADGTFQNPVFVSTTTVEFEQYESFGVADLNGDGIPDFWAFGVAGDNIGNAIFSILGNGNGTFQPPVLYTVTEAGYNTGPMVEADFNNDGKLDFQIANDCLGVSCMQVSLQSPVVASPTALNFGTSLIKGRSKPLAVILSNSGTTAISVGTPSFTGSFPADFAQTNNCPASLASEATCTFEVYFDPSTEDYYESATLSISDSGPGGSQQVALTGYGTYIRETPGSLAFCDVAIGQSSTLSSTLTNTKTTTLSVGRIYVVPSAFGKEFSVTNNCGTSLAAGAQCQVTVTFTPTTTGHAAAKINVSFGGDQPPDIQVSGSGT
jgi:hypothetical protein